MEAHSTHLWHLSYHVQCNQYNYLRFSLFRSLADSHHKQNSWYVSNYTLRESKLSQNKVSARKKKVRHSCTMSLYNLGVREHSIIHAIISAASCLCCFTCCPTIWHKISTNVAWYKVLRDSNGSL
jgi:hypothetical protein